MFTSDDELRDWEIREEEPPKGLKKKWAESEKFDPKTILCRFCQQPIPSDSMNCLFCGASVFLGSPKKGFFSWLKQLFKRS